MPPPAWLEALRDRAPDVAAVWLVLDEGAMATGVALYAAAALHRSGGAGGG